MKMNCLDFQNLIDSASGSLNLRFNQEGEVFVNDRAADNALKAHLLSLPFVRDVLHAGLDEFGTDDPELAEAISALLANPAYH